MKIREHLISNSSSTSFLISKRHLNAKQIAMIIDPPTEHSNGISSLTDYASIVENDDAIAGHAENGMHWIEEWLIDTVKVDHDKIIMGG